MTFEYDPLKSAANKAKHGIDFDEAQGLWDDERLIQAPARMADEPRTIAIGRIARLHWAVIFTWRGDVIRIISVRRARKEEVEKYETQSG